MSKILIIQPSIPPYRVSFFECLANTLEQELTILHFGTPSGISHPLINEVIGEFIEIRNIKYILDLKSILEEYMTIITVFDPHWINAFLLPLTHTDKKIILWGHGLGKNKFISNIRKKLFQKANSIITYNQEGKSKIVDLGINQDKIFIANNTLLVENSINTSDSSEKNFLYVGRLQRRKRLDIFLDIFSELNLGSKGYTITILGNGAEEKLYLEGCSKKLNIEQYINFVSGTANENILMNYFSKALYYVSPEAAGLGVIHSFAYGVPVLTMKSSNHGPEVNNIINIDNGYIFDDIKHFKDTLLILLKSSTAKNMGNNAFEMYRAERNIENMVNSFIEAIYH